MVRVKLWSSCHVWAASFISGSVLSSSQSKAVEPGAVSQRVLLSLPLHQQQGLCLCVLIHFLSVLFKIIPLFLSLFQLVVLSGAQNLHDKLHQCRLAILLFLFFVFCFFCSGLQTVDVPSCSAKGIN